MATPGSSGLSEPDGQDIDPQALRREWLILVTVGLGTMLAPLNSTMIAVALPQIMDRLRVDVSSAGWLATAYLIAMASLQPVTGKIGDRLGRRWLILGGLLYFGAASTGAALSTSLPMLLFFRVQQGIAGAVALPNGMALMREIVPAGRRASRFGLLGALIALAAAGGPPLGGLLVEVLGWQSIFYVNVLFIVPALILGWSVLPSRPPGPRDRGVPFDLVGALLLSLLLIGLAWLLTQSRRGEVLVGLLPGSIGMLSVAAFFLWWELRHSDPVLQPRFFTRRAFAAATSAISLSNLAMYSTLFSFPILLSGQAGWTDLRIGLLLTAMSAAMVLFAPLGGRLADRFGRRWPTVAGLVLLSAGLLLLRLTWRIGPEVATAPALPLLLVGLGLIGVGVGLASAGLQTSAVEAVEPHEAGVASGVFSTSRYLGSIVGTSALAVLLGGQVAGAAVASDGVEAMFLMVIVAALLSVGVSLGLRDRPVEVA
jgi:EmrB/QacA subfamily drug resistance transporter